MGLSDGTFFMIKHTPLPNGNHHILSPVCPMGVADTLEQRKVCTTRHYSVILSYDVIEICNIYHGKSVFFVVVL